MTPTVSNTPTRTATPSLTFTPLPSSTFTSSTTPEANADCVYPESYWEEHPELWLEILLGNTMYTKDDIRLVFDNASQGTHHIVLLQVYIANLNIFSGADPTVIEDVLGEADKWLQEYMPYKQLTEESRQLGIQLAQTLIEFNSGLIGPGFCAPYESLTVTPLVVIPTATRTNTATLTATATATRVVVTQRPTAVSTKTKKPDKEPKPTDRPRPTKEPPPKPTEPPPKPTKPPPEPTDAPPEPTSAP